MQAALDCACNLKGNKNNVDHCAEAIVAGTDISGYKRREAQFIFDVPGIGENNEAHIVGE